METLFENRYTRDRSVFEEFFGYSYFKTPYAIYATPFWRSASF